ncbi:MAG: rhodanese-like domain-containing protein [Rhizobiaceae bacterium]
MGYAGDVTPKECWGILGTDKTAILIDVRTRAEWSFVGLPTLAKGMQPLVTHEWQAFPEMKVDDGFAADLSAKLQQQGANYGTQLCFLCRSGGRSLAAAKALTTLGYEKAYNITGGFEGDPDENAHRGNRSGWKAEGLPWMQG